jgi:hypothetical protein
MKIEIKKEGYCKKCEFITLNEIKYYDGVCENCFKKQIKTREYDKVERDEENQKRFELNQLLNSKYYE